MDFQLHYIGKVAGTAVAANETTAAAAAGTAAAHPWIGLRSQNGDAGRDKVDSEIACAVRFVRLADRLDERDMEGRHHAENGQNHRLMLLVDENPQLATLIRRELADMVIPMRPSQPGEKMHTHTHTETHTKAHPTRSNHTHCHLCNPKRLAGVPWGSKGGHGGHNIKATGRGTPSISGMQTHENGRSTACRHARPLNGMQTRTAAQRHADKRTTE